MDDIFKQRAAARTDEELRERVDNREKYLPETVEASVAELQSRGETFSDEELTVIYEDMQARRAIAGTPPEGFTFFNNRDTNNLIEDPDAMSFYSRRVVYIFSVLFSVPFGSIMLAMNVAKTPNKNNAIWVVLFGIGYAVATIIIGENTKLNSTSSFMIFTSIIGSYLMEALFWNRFIGNTTLYRARPIWVPLIIGVLLAGSILVIIFNSGQMPGSVNK